MKNPEGLASDSFPFVRVIVHSLEKGFFCTAAGTNPILGQAFPAYPLLLFIIDVSADRTFVSCHRIALSFRIWSQHFTMSEDFSIVARASLNCPPLVSFQFQAILIIGSPLSPRSQTDEKDEILAKLAAGDLGIEEASNLLDELDIANRKRTEEDLATNQALLQATIDNLPFDFFAIGLDGRYILQNAVSKTHWGNAIGKRPEEICPNEQDLALWMENNRRAFSGERIEEDVSMLCNGEKRFYNNILNAIRSDGTTYGILGMNIDITERKRAEEELRASEAKYRRLHESMMDAFASVNMDGFIQEFNQAFCKMLGYEPEEIVKLRYTDITPDKWHSLQAEIIEKQVLARGYSEVYEKEYRRKDGTIFPVELRNCLIRDETGRPAGILAVVRDITERKRAEEALLMANNELERKVQERTAELVQANENLDIFRKFAEASGEGFGMSDFYGRIAYVNPTLCRFFGEKRPEDVIGKNVSTYYPEEYVQRRQKEMIPALLREGNWQIEQIVLPRHGEPFQTLQSTFLIQDENGNPFRIAVVISDITERKKAEDALRESEEKYRILVQACPDAVVMSDSEMRIIFASQQAVALHGAASEEEMIGQSLTAFIAEEERPRAIAGVSELVKSGVRRKSEYTFLRKDGTRYPCELSSGVVKSDSGRLKGIIAIVRDISERKQAEEARRKSEERFRSYFEQGLLGMAISGEDMRWTEVNDRLCNIIGCSREEAFQRKITDFLHPDDLEAFHRSYNQLISGETDHYTSERRYILNDGKVIYVNIFVKGFRSENGRLDHILALLDDVTEWRQAEAALRQSHDELRTIYEEMADGIIIVTIENPHPLRANAAICRMLGYSEEEMRTILPASVHPPEVLPIVQEHLEALKQHGVARIADFPFLRKDGKLVYADVVVSQIAYDGQPCGISFLHDVTERKQAEEALQKEHRTLKHLLQSSDHERQTIAYEIHDGLAQYLAAAIMQFDVYRSHREKKPNEATKAYDAAMTLLRQGHSEARRLIAGIRHPVLDEAGVVEAIAHLINEQNREIGPEIEFNSHVKFSRLVPLLENAVYRIVQAGMTNACKYSQSSRVRITLLQQKDRLRIEIRDWGIGFDTTSVKEGSYGLTGIRERARLLGGKYRLKSAAGKGTRIVVELPLVEREE